MTATMHVGYKCDKCGKVKTFDTEIEFYSDYLFSPDRLDWEGDTNYHQHWLDGSKFLLLCNECFELLSPQEQEAGKL